MTYVSTIFKIVYLSWSKDLEVICPIRLDHTHFLRVNKTHTQVVEAENPTTDESEKTRPQNPTVFQNTTRNRHGTWSTSREPQM